jgi:hypothetical protein
MTLQLRFILSTLTGTLILSTSVNAETALIPLEFGSMGQRAAASVTAPTAPAPTKSSASTSASSTAATPSAAPTPTTGCVKSEAEIQADTDLGKEIRKLLGDKYDPFVAWTGVQTPVPLVLAPTKKDDHSGNMTLHISDGNIPFHPNIPMKIALCIQTSKEGKLVPYLLKFGDKTNADPKYRPDVNVYFNDPKGNSMTLVDGSYVTHYARDTSPKGNAQLLIESNSQQAAQ